MAIGGFRLTINVAAFNEFRNSGPVTDLIQSTAEQIAARANAQVGERRFPDDGDPFQVKIFHNPTRVAALVVTSGFDGELAEAQNRALSQAV